MRKLSLLLTLLLVAAAGRLHGEEWAKSFTVTGKPDLKVDASEANVQVDTWDQNLIAVQLTAVNYKIGQSIKIEDHQAGDSVEIRVYFPSHLLNFGLRSHRVDVAVHLPREGRINLHTGDGHIKVTNFKGEMNLESGDGHQEIESVEGSLRAHTSDGHIRASGRFDHLELMSGDGRIEAAALAGSLMSSNWDLHTGDGSVTLQVPENFAADVDLHTGDGHISLDLPISVSGQLKENNIHGKLNGGGKLLTIHTGDGSITLEKS